MKASFLSLLLSSILLVSSALAQSGAGLRPATLQRLQQLVAPRPAGHLAARSATASGRVPATAVRYHWEPGTSTWEAPVAIAYTYNGRGQVTQEVLTDSATAEPLNRILTTYNAAATPTEVREQFWNGSAWADESRHVWVYDSRQNPLEERREYFDGTAWVITAGTRYLNTLNAANYLTAQVVQRYDDATSTFVNKVRHEYLVPANGVWQQETIQRWHNNAWEDSTRATAIVWHDFAKRQITSALLQNPVGTQWVTKGRLAGTFSPTAEVTVVEQLTASGTYRNFARFSTYYDAQGTLTASGVEGWDDIANAWEFVLQEQRLLAYDAAGDLRRRIDQVQVPFLTMGLQNTERYHFDGYQSVVLANRTHNPAAQVIMASPNPSPEGRFELHTTALPGAATVRVLDALARPVWQRHYPHGLPARLGIELDRPAAGLYVVEVLREQGPARLRLQVQ